ncbi:MAG: 5-formyltetrahydrofolate cyclo-ligase [Candidatus Thermoplasmatota archaeon]|nr:5-formyltetrahydrofolate cyclo-ligase [Candidatus Thermoplasmatota archaeon]
MKDKVRKELIELRKNLSRKEVFEKSNEIKNRLFKLNQFIKASTVMFYVSYDNEVYTHEMIKDCLANKKNVIVPITDKKNKRLILSKLEKWDDLSPGVYNILEPRKEKIKEASIDEIDLIIVPGVGFDEKGNRIGHGIGFYDKLLKDSKSKFIGLAFEFQVIKNIPIEKHDIKMDKIVTEKRIIICKKTK